MHVHHAETSIRTGGAVRAHDVSAAVREAVRATGVGAGLVVVSVPHATCALYVNENEAGLRGNVERLARELLEPLARADGFAHDRIDDNARAHLMAILLAHQVTLPVLSGEPVLGTWQSIFLLEMDGPRARTLHVQVLGE
jgi:secondary thiamine-phosphate synthase enzyme